ncbi:MAG TPA: pantoate--beta-alanine ligase [Kiritimatiellia bacterium]|nr:pantoate--beta-alanine ligase [Kiritimatiellia bacterium]
MEIIRSTGAMQAWSRRQRLAGRVIGLVPTMGYLHEGHLSLMRMARERADAVVVSIFVNPTQFGPGEDFDRYPRDFAGDEKRCRSEGVDVVFYPDAAEMYPPEYSTYVVEEALGQGLCGTSRPGHFRGVTTVVAKLLNLTLPDVAVFGEKDGQQLRVIRRMVRDLNFPVMIVAGPTTREADGLAMSSRNVLLSPEDRIQAPAIWRALSAARLACDAGQVDAAGLLALVRDAITREAPRAHLDYLALVDDETLRPVEKIERPALLAVAAFFGATRLIDNIVLTPRPV